MLFRSRAVVGGATMRLFGKKCTLKKGKQRLFLWRGHEADGSSDSETPSKVGLKDEMGRLEKLVKKQERGDMPRLDWLDKLAFRQIEKIHAVGTARATARHRHELTPRRHSPSRPSPRTCSSTSTCPDSTFRSSLASPCVLQTCGACER